ncbi:MAG: hypothetical protein DHS20C04_23980 [Hyphococcus sp.]|nr:MAG: hypothetical protein DHS20C04_23980 [Marinicaulis sp.]
MLEKLEQYLQPPKKAGFEIPLPDISPKSQALSHTTAQRTDKNTLEHWRQESTGFGAGAKIILKFTVFFALKENKGSRRNRWDGTACSSYFIPAPASVRAR